MASSRNERIPRHIHLRTHQRRLRHVVRFMVRNFTPPATAKFEIDELQLQVSLHGLGSDKDIYRSEIITGTRNPHWAPIKFHTRSSDLIPNSFDVCVWYNVSTEDGPFQLAWKETVCLPNMHYMGLNVHLEGKIFPPNTLFLHTADGLYCGENGSKVSVSDGEEVTSFHVAKPFQNQVMVEEVLIRPCYHSLLLKKLLECDQRYATSQKHCLEAEQNLSMVWKKKQHLLKLQHQREVLRARCDQHRQQLEEEKLRLEEDTTELISAQGEISRHRRGLSDSLTSYTSDVSRLRSYVEYVHGQFGDVRRNSSNRKKIMIEDLSTIFRVEMPSSGPPVPLICGVPLTAIEDLQKAKHVDKAPVSLGHLVHVVHLLSVVLAKPLRFPLVVFGSQSAVRDDVLLEGGGIETREFPLSYRKDQKNLFFHAMQLLRHDLAQLRSYCNITSPKKDTQQKSMLLLLKDLFDKVGASPGSEKLGRPKSVSVASSSSVKDNTTSAEIAKEDEENGAIGDTPPSHQGVLLERYPGKTPNKPTLLGESPRGNFTSEPSSSPEEYHLQHNGCETLTSNVVPQAAHEPDTVAEL